MRILLFIIAFSLSWSSYSQTRRHMAPLYDLYDPGMKNSGWHFSPGITYMIPSKNQIVNETGLEGVWEQINPAGRIGLYAEVGRHHLFDKFYFLDHLDYGIAYKRFSGRSSMQLVCDDCDLVGGSESSFKDNFVGGYVNFSNIIQLSDYTFLQNGFGINGDYRVALSNEVATAEGTFTGTDVPQALQIQAHYKLSIGFKAEKGTFIVPSVEIPILNIMPWDKWRSTLIYNGAGYRPLIISVKFMFLSKRKAADCKGSSDGTTGHKLWDKKMRR